VLLPDGTEKTESTETKTESTETKTESTETKTESTETKTESTETKTESTETKTESTETKGRERQKAWLSRKMNSRSSRATPAGSPSNHVANRYHSPPKIGERMGRGRPEVVAYLKGRSE